MPTTTLPPAEILVIAAADEFLPTNSGKFVDPVWQALREVLGLSGSPAAYSHGANEFLAELRAHKLFLEDRDRFWRLHPPLRQRRGAFITGVYHQGTAGGRSAIVFASDLRLNTDGPTMPVVRLLTQLVREAQPRLVVHVGLGAGVRAEHQIGDVVVTNRARFELRGELEGSRLNDQTYGGAWRPAPSLVDGLTFDELREPALLPPSPHYEDIPHPQPPPHRPQVRLENLPVVTRPRVTDTIFDIPSPDAGDPSYWAEAACAVDMDAAPVAAACGELLPCAFVLGLAAPAIRRFEYDYESSLRRAWAEHMVTSFATESARNAAQVVRRIIESA